MAAFASPMPSLSMPVTVLPERERDPRLSETADTAAYLEELHEHIYSSIAALRQGQMKALDIDFVRMDQQLVELASLKEGWDGYDAPAPSATAVNDARFVLRELHEEVLLPLRVGPSAEGGIAFTFIAPEDRRAQIEILNNGERFAHLYDLSGNSYTQEWPQDYKQLPFENLLEPVITFMQI